MVPSWVQWTGALGSIAIALLAFITLVYSERFRNWTRRLRKPTPVLAEAWIEQRTGPLRFFLHLGFVNPGEAPIFITRVVAKLSIYPFNLSLPNDYLRVDDQGLVRPFGASSLGLKLRKDDPLFLEMLVDYLEPRARGFAIEFITGSDTRVRSWQLPKIGDATHPCDTERTELLPLAKVVPPDRLAWLPWRG